MNRDVILLQSPAGDRFIVWPARLSSLARNGAQATLFTSSHYLESPIMAIAYPELPGNEAMFKVAMDDVGYQQSGGSNKYGEWLDKVTGRTDFRGADFCGMGWLYAASITGQAKELGGTNPDFAMVQNWLDYFKSKRMVSMHALPYSLVWFDWPNTPPGANHMGGVIKYSRGILHTIEYNTLNRQVETRERAFDSSVMAFAMPPYRAKIQVDKAKSIDDTQIRSRAR